MDPTSFTLGFIAGAFVLFLLGLVLVVLELFAWARGVKW